MQPNDQHENAGHAENSSTKLVHQGLQRVDQEVCNAVSGMEASQHQSVQMQMSHRQQPTAATPTVDASVNAYPRLPNLSKDPAQRGVIKAYNLQALMD